MMGSSGAAPTLDEHNFLLPTEVCLLQPLFGCGHPPWRCPLCHSRISSQDHFLDACRQSLGSASKSSELAANEAIDMKTTMPWNCNITQRRLQESLCMLPAEML